ncbi:MAG: PAS domain S-box protein [Bacteroidales bacterium]|nr:PAS domain S-box protein [Bacteroidales bacterium]
MKIINKQALKISLIFLALSFLWILYSDKILLSLLSDPEKLTRIQTYKGWFYVLTASVIIYLLVKREIAKTLFIEKDLKIEQSKYKLLFETANDAIFIMNENNFIVDCNRKALELFNCNRDQIIGITPVDVSPQFQANNVESLKLVAEKNNNARKGIPQRFEWLLTTFDKTKEFSAEVSLTMTLIGNVNHLFAIVRNISDRKLAELELKTKNYEYETLNEELKKKFEELQAAEEELQASNEELAYINDELRYSEEKYKLLSDLSQEGIFIHNQGVLLEFNKAFCNIFGYKHDELIGVYIFDKIIVSKYMDMIWKSIKKGNMGTFSIEGIKKDGTIIWVELEGRNTRYQDKTARVVTLRDITEKIEKENALIESEERYKTVADFTYDWEYWQLPDGKFEYISPSCVEITGYTHEEFFKNPLLLDSIIVKEDLESWNNHKENEIIKNEQNKNILKDEETQCELVFRIKTKNGDLKWIGHHCQSVFDKERNYFGKRGSNRDITKQKYAEEQLKMQKEHFRLMVENMPVLINAFDKDGNFIFWNRECEKVTGYKADEVIGSNKVLDKLYPDTQYRKKKIDLNLDTVSNLEIDLLNRKGDKKTVLWTNINKPAPLKQWYNWEVGINITERKIAEQSLIESEEKFRMMVEKGPSVFWIRDINSKTKYISPNVKGIFDFTSKEIIEKGSEILINRIHKQDIEYVSSNYKSILTENKNYNVTYRIKNKNGKWIWLHDLGEKYINDKGEELIYSVFTDITLKKQTDQKILHVMINAEERERSRIAKDLHDGVSPVLSAIKLYIQSMNDSSNEDIKNELSEKINDTIIEAIESIKEISNNISPHILQNFGLIKAVESFVNKLRGLKQLNISIDSKLTERLSIDIETALYRITTELINNTFKYAKAKNVSIKYFIQGNEVIMKYSDDGIGFNLDQVWKNKIGMGIFNLKNRISSLNGQYNISSEPNNGISVYISVPVNE